MKGSLRKRPYVRDIGCFLVGGLCTVVFYHATQVGGDFVKGLPLRDVDTEYAFIKPLLACDIGVVEQSASFSDLREQMLQVIEQQKTAGKVEEASVYMRVLDTGAWMGIAEDEHYRPASLSKVPIMMAYLKRAEYDSTLLAKTVTVTAEMVSTAVQDIPPLEQAEIGKTYTIEELLRLMIIHSDNRALEILFRSIDVVILDEMMADVGIPEPDNLSAFRISPRLYSRFLRILYNATFLSEEMSEKALAMMTEVSYDQGLRSTLPQSVSFAHKFGEASVALANGTIGHELHECGIVYTKEPYVICIMTRGEKVEDLQQTTKEIGERAYRFLMEKERGNDITTGYDENV